MLDAAQDGIGNNKSQATEIFGVVQEVKMQAALQEADGRAISDDSFEACVVAKTAVNTWSSGSAKWRRITRPTCIREQIGA
ncbi:hypothetical protein H7F10_16495 [Acidithiobacillus sp. HP-6]|nr:MULTISPECIES: hypothetical protein [unclassified Acidithiobacillus]MBE7564475.1 hypothetical protein [Acidithiobacillus sp. HP-6]MBE7571105.1 hypothetical protein [Acidithiobacillus sp. HP-2]